MTNPDHKRVTMPELFLLKELLILSKNNNSKLDFEDFKGYDVIDIGKNTSYSSTKVREHMRKLLARGLVRLKIVGSTHYYFPNVIENNLNEAKINELLQERVQEFMK